MSKAIIDYSKSITTTGGYEVRNIRWSQTAKMYVGQIKDPNWEGKWVSCTWDKNGEHWNIMRQDFNLVKAN